MFDPETLIRDFGFVSIWHKDPCRDGSDDSCGWSYVRAPQELRDRVRKLGEAEQPFINGKHGYEMQPSELLMEVWLTIAGNLYKRPRRFGGSLTHREFLYVLSLANNPGDNLRHSCKSAGTPEGMGKLFVLVLRCYQTFHRKWWQHPRWHLRHWRIHVRRPAFLRRFRAQLAKEQTP